MSGDTIFPSEFCMGIQTIGGTGFMVTLALGLATGLQAGIVLIKYTQFLWKVPVKLSIGGPRNWQFAYYCTCPPE